MSTAALYIIYAGAFVSVLLFLEALYFLYQDHFVNANDINRRMRMINKKGDGKAALSLLRAKNETGIAAMLSNIWPSLDQMIWMAGASMSKRSFLYLVTAIALALTLFFRLGLSLPLDLALIAGAAFGVVGGWVVLKNLADRGQQTLTEQLPNSIDLMIRGLEAGHPVSVAMSLVSKEMPDPIGTEFGIAIDEMTYGLSMEDALVNMVERFPNPDLKFLAISVQVQRETGGNLVEILKTLSHTLRERLAMYKKIKAISAEGRLSAVVVSLLPFLVGLAIMVLRPDYYTDVSADPLFFPALIVACILLATGATTIWRMVNMKV